MRGIVEGGAVLGDVHREVAVALLDPDEHARERFGENLPVHLGVDALRLPHARGAQRMLARRIAHDVARVVVDAEEVEGSLDERPVFGGEFGPHLAEGFGELGRILSEEDGIEIVPVHVRVGARGGSDVFGLVGRGILGLEIDDESDLVLAARAIVLNGGAVRAEEIVRDGGHFADVAMTGRVRADHVPIVHHDPRLVERHPARNAIVERAEARVRVLAEPLRDVAIEPAAAVAECFGEIPVVERDHGRDVLREQRVDQFVVERDAGGVDLARALWEGCVPS